MAFWGADTPLSSVHHPGYMTEVGGERPSGLLGLTSKPIPEKATCT